jgi:hypothetical protein
MVTTRAAQKAGLGARGGSWWAAVVAAGGRGGSAGAGHMRGAPAMAAARRWRRRCRVGGEVEEVGLASWAFMGY